jgi:hypothetical protein
LGITKTFSPVFRPPLLVELELVEDELPLLLA